LTNAGFSCWLDIGMSLYTTFIYIYYSLITYYMFYIIICSLTYYGMGHFT